MIRRHILGLLMATAVWGPQASARAAEAQRRFITGYAGSLPKDPKDLARTYFNQPVVRRLIYALESGPVAVAEAKAMLQGSPASLDDLLRLKLVRVAGEQVRLAFAYFNAADMRLIHAVAAKHVPSLVAAYRGKSRTFDAIWADYPVASVERRKLAFALIAGVGLNWDGLDLLFDEGWRKPQLVSGPGWQYGFFASEDIGDIDYKGFYWGSSAFPGDIPVSPPMPLAFVSFGDPESDPRMNFPDLLDMKPSTMTASVRAAAEKVGFRDDPILGQNVLGLEAGRGVGRLLLRLRAGPASPAALEAALPGDRAPAELDLLQAAGYVRARPDGRFELTAPVLDTADRAMLDRARALNKAIVRDWMRASYGPIRGELAGLTALRQGVAYEALFTQIWHEIFGLATRELAASGMVADPRDPQNPSPGSLAMAWRPDILQRAWR
jgi:hypothetical protein